jgi:hypothetical protein
MYPATPLPHWSYETPPPYWYPGSGVAGHMTMVDAMRPPIRLPHCARTIVSGSFNGAPSSQGAARAAPVKAPLLTQIHHYSLDSPFLRPQSHLDGGGPVTVLTLLKKNDLRYHLQGLPYLDRSTELLHLKRPHMLPVIVCQSPLIDTDPQLFP